MLFNLENFNALKNRQAGTIPCVSIYIPTHRAGHVQEDKIRFKNALAEVKSKLQTKAGMHEREAEGMLKPAYDLLNLDSLWFRLSDGLAVFIGQDLFEYYPVPIDLNPLNYVSDQFYLLPLLPLLNRKDRFFLLALSRGDVRFFEGHQYSITPVKISDLVPENIQAALALEDPEKSLQMRNAGPGGASVFHGHGLHKDQQNWQVEKYCRMVDDGLMTMLHDENAPMLLAAVDELASVYQKVSRYTHVLDAHVSGNPENDDPVLLHEKAWGKMQAYFQKDLIQQQAQFETAQAKGQGTSSLKELVPAAVHGRVETLFIEKNTPLCWGAYNENTNTVSLHDTPGPASVCLHNLAAVRAFDQGGTVVQVDDDGQHSAKVASPPMRAVFRY
ncbi:MAG: hypothetical protein R3D58_05160 [Saprospiraceae bacterium]